VEPTKTNVADDLLLQLVLVLLTCLVVPVREGVVSAIHTSSNVQYDYGHGVMLKKYRTSPTIEKSF
jgi:hypothetical protein